MLARSSCSQRRVEITLADPARRNALGTAMFTALHQRLMVAALAADGRLLAPDGTATGADVAVLRGEGQSFCAGFDLAACATAPGLLRPFVLELSRAVLSLRALSIPVIAQVQGSALAGGCALLAGCDFVVVAPDAQLGYPVHRIGVSPAVTLPALMANAGAGAAREIAVGGRVHVGEDAVRAGLATHCARSAASLQDEVDALADLVASKGPRALRATKRWLNELDGTDGAVPFAHAAEASAAAAEGDEFARLLGEFWASRARG